MFFRDDGYVNVVIGLPVFLVPYPYGFLHSYCQALNFMGHRFSEWCSFS